AGHRHGTGGADRLLRGAAAAVDGAAVRRVRGRAAPHPHRQDRQVPAAGAGRPRHHRDDLGPGGGRPVNWDDTPEQAAFRREVRAFIEDRFPASYRPAHDEEQSLEPEDVAGYNWPVDRVSDDPERREGAREWAAALAERGWIAPHWPREYGGAGLSDKEEFVLHEEMMGARERAGELARLSRTAPQWLRE